MALDHSCEVTLWSQGVFGLGEGSLEALVRRMGDFDFAVLVLTADDLVESRGQRRQSPRDNVLLELGMFIGRLGPTRTFAVYDRTAGIKLPSDLAGVTMADYRLYSSGNLDASLGSACTRIKRAIEAQGLFLRLPSSDQASQDVAVDPGSAQPRELVVDRINHFMESLQKAYEDSTSGRGKLSESFPEKELKRWKYDVLKFLDANFESDEAAPFADLHSAESSAVPLGHLTSSVQEHREFLERLRDEVLEGRGELRIPPRPSGNRLPRFGTFSYRN